VSTTVEIRRNLTASRDATQPWSRVEGAGNLVTAAAAA
jgi:hypothetical protein